MKKFFATLVAVLLLAGAFSGCYMTKAGKYKDVIGTYELVNYSRSGEGAVDYIERDEIVCYLVVKDGSGGYYVYKDKNNVLSVREVKITLTADTEDTSKYEYVTYQLGETSGEIKLGYASGNLNATTYQATGQPLTDSFNMFGAQIYRSFKRVDKATDLSYVENKLGDLPATMGYGVGAYDCFYVHSFYRYNNESEFAIINENYDEPFVYAFVDLSVSEGKATVYYALKTNPDDRKVEVYDLSLVTIGSTATVTIGDTEVDAELINSSAQLYFPTSVTYGDGETLEFDLTFIGQARNLSALDQMITDAIEDYNNSLAGEQGE